MNGKYLLFEVSGDLMKDLAGTAVVANLKKKFPEREIIVTTFWPEAWLHHPDVYRVYKLGTTAYFYDDFIGNKDTLIFRLDPYLTDDFLYHRKHLIEIWSKLCEAPCEFKRPQLYFTAREREATGKMLNRNLPLFIFETQALINKMPLDIWQIEPSISTIPVQTIMPVVNNLQKAGFFPLHLKRSDENPLPGVEWINLPMRQVLYAVSLSQKNLFLNSFARQTAGALDFSAAIISSEEDSRSMGYQKEIRIGKLSPDEILKKIL
jgi:hypothetical protein